MRHSGWMVVMVSVVSVMTVYGVDITWQGTNNASWTASTNWVGGVVPANNATDDRAVFAVGTGGASVKVDATRSVAGLVIQRDTSFNGSSTLTLSPTGVVVSAGCSVMFNNPISSGTYSLDTGSILTFSNTVNYTGNFFLTNATINFTTRITYNNGGTFNGSGVVNYASTYTNTQNLRLTFKDTVGLAIKSEAWDPVNNNDMMLRFQGGPSTLSLEKDFNFTVSDSTVIGGTKGPLQLWNSSTTTVSGPHTLTISQLTINDGTNPTLLLDGATLTIGDGGGVAEGVYCIGGGGSVSDFNSGGAFKIAATANGGTLRVNTSPWGSNFNSSGGGIGAKISVLTNAALICNCTWTNRILKGTGSKAGLTVTEGATLGGTGIFAMASSTNGYMYTDVSGRVAPGDNGIGILTVACTNFTWNSVSTNGSKWVWDLGPNNAADKLLIDGNFKKGSAGAGKFFFDLQNVTSSGSFVLVEWTDTTTFIASDFAVLNGTGRDTFTISGKQLLLTVPPKGTMIRIF